MWIIHIQSSLYPELWIIDGDQTLDGFVAGDGILEGLEDGDGTPDGNCSTGIDGGADDGL